MSANYWIKLYIEILNDSKMAVLPDRLWRRSVELFMAAGYYNDNGNLPDTQQLAWLLRMNTDDLEIDMKQIATTRIIQRTATGWLVTKFKERQAPVPGNERVKQFRDRQKKQQYYGDVTEMKRDVTQINRLTDNRLTDTETETDPALAGTWFSARDVLPLFCKATGMMSFPSDQQDRVEQILQMVEGYGEEQVEAALRGAYNRWIDTPRKNGSGTYSGTNLTWINWAQDDLAKTFPDPRTIEIPDINKDPAAYAAYLAEKYKDEP